MMWIVKWPCLFSVFQFLLECRFKELVVDVSRSTDSLPPPSPGFSSRGVICYRTTGTSLRVSVWIIFSPFTVLPSFQFHKHSLSQSSYYVNQLCIVSHFCLPGDRYWASWECKCNSVSYYMPKEHFHHILLTFQSCLLTDRIFVWACV